MTENDVVRAVASHLERIGYRVNKKLTTLQRGIDIEAVHLASGKRLLIEAKGGTSSKPGTKRHGKDFNAGQALSHVPRALFTAARLLQEFSDEQAHVALAFPSDIKHRALVNKVSYALAALHIAVFFVIDDDSVVLVGKLGEP